MSDQKTGGFLPAFGALWKTAFSTPENPSQIQHKFVDPERAKLQEAISSNTKDKEISTENWRFCSAVAITNKHLDQQGIPLSTHSREKLEKNVVSVAKEEYGPTLGHATEVATFIVEAGVATRNLQGNRFGEAVIGIVVNSAATMGTGNQEKINRTIGK